MTSAHTVDSEFFLNNPGVMRKWRREETVLEERPK